MVKYTLMALKNLSALTFWSKFHCGVCHFFPKKLARPNVQFVHMMTFIKLSHFLKLKTSMNALKIHLTSVKAIVYLHGMACISHGSSYFEFISMRQYFKLQIITVTL